MPDLRPSAALQRRYAEHNASRGLDFIYGGQPRVAEMRRALPDRAGRVLDLGCRDGALLEALGIQTSCPAGVDIDRAALRRAAALGRVLPAAANLWSTRLPFRAGVFDIVIAGEVLEHLPFPEMIVVEASRVLRPGGVFVGSVPNAYRLKNRLLFLTGRPFERDPTHLRYFSPSQLVALMGSHFVSVQVRPCVGRAVRLWPRMLANDLVWTAVKRP